MSALSSQQALRISGSLQQKIRKPAEFLHGEGLCPSAEIDAGQSRFSLQLLLRGVQLPQGVSECLSALGKASLHDTQEEALVPHGVGGRDAEGKRNDRGLHVGSRCERAEREREFD